MIKVDFIILPRCRQMTFNTYNAMSRYIATAIAAVVITSLASWLRAEQISKIGPLLHIASTKVDLGKIPQSESREVLFLVENKGSRRLVLNEVSCDCGVSNRTAILIQAGKSNKVKVRLDTQFELGQIEQTVSFTTNDVTQPRVDLTVLAHITK